ncbi:MAG: segregation/condensation protein A [Candidatus Delongbacteria bacterium]|nr:segregation/condensation protein A [Candidatus Delongbacteria bacterium]
MPFEVCLDKFEGPLDLLLYLIKREEVDIYDIPIAKITGDYLDLLERIKGEKVAVAGEFFIMAATLIRIKTQMLLPRQACAELDQIEDPRRQLVIQLLEYQQFKELSESMSRLAHQRSEVFFRSFYPEIRDLMQEKQLEFDRNQFLSIFKSVLQKMDPRQNYEIELEPITIEWKMQVIYEKLQKDNHIRFSQLVMETSLSDKVISFMAILELSKLQRIHLIQNRNFEEIWLERIAG